jgi:DNA-binding response OmpR family regulator
MTDAAPLRTILLADDDLEMRRLVRRAISGLPVRIVEATDGEEAIEKVIIEQPDVTVLDVMMPNFSGWEVLKYIRSKPAYANMGVLMLTGVGHTVNALTAPLYGADAYLDKPFDLDEVREVIEGLLNRELDEAEASEPEQD